jgi:hypothetical protein
MVFSDVVREPAFAWLAETLGWRRLGGPQQFSQSLESVWEPDDHGTRVTYVDDHVLPLQYLIVRGSPEDVRAVHDQVSPKMPFYSLDSARTFLNPSRADHDPILALYLAALIAPAHADPEILRWFQDAMESSDPELRRAAYAATTYPAWREFEPWLRSASTSDPDPAAKDTATRALAGLTKNVWEKE